MLVGLTPGVTTSRQRATATHADHPRAALDICSAVDALAATGGVAADAGITNAHLVATSRIAGAARAAATVGLAQEAHSAVFVHQADVEWRDCSGARRTREPQGETEELERAGARACVHANGVPPSSWSWERPSEENTDVRRSSSSVMVWRCEGS